MTLTDAERRDVEAAVDLMTRLQKDVFVLRMAHTMTSSPDDRMRRSAETRALRAARSILRTTEQFEFERGNRSGS